MNKEVNKEEQERNAAIITGSIGVIAFIIASLVLILIFISI